MVDSLMGLLTEHPVVAVVAVLVLIALVLNWGRGSMPRRDPQRAFSASQTQIGMSRAGHRCEMGVLRRCRSGAHHGDHFYPHSRGGASNLANFVAACQRHNLSKGAKMPSRLLQTAIELRRAKYFGDADVRAGAWFGGGR